MKHAVLGVGAIGGLIGVALVSAGEDVTFIVRAEKAADYPDHLTLEQPTDSITVAAPAVTKLTDSVDVLWIATKAYQLESALLSVNAIPRLIVPLLNGVDHIALLRSRFGHDRVIPATIAVEADRTAQDRFVQRSMVRLSLAASGRALLSSLFATLQERLGFICRFVENEQTLLWTKLCFLAPFALASSASGKNKGDIISDPEWKSTLYSTIAEATAVAKAYGAEIDATAIQTILDTSPDTMRSSMLKDLIAGRQPELDAIGGPIVRGGEKFHIPTPMTKRLIAEITASASAVRL
ncbi:MAG TPA: 2-dehydropantoate 2-reductase [Terriglobales bacterium]|nr:2-dehydropantoate 2-reductase [Terriglobales bacterium]